MGGEVANGERFGVGAADLASVAMADFAGGVESVGRGAGDGWAGCSLAVTGEIKQVGDVGSSWVAGDLSILQTGRPPNVRLSHPCSTITITTIHNTPHKAKQQHTNNDGSEGNTGQAGRKRDAKTTVTLRNTADTRETQRLRTQ